MDKLNTKKLFQELDQKLEQLSGSLNQIQDTEPTQSSHLPIGGAAAPTTTDDDPTKPATSTQQAPPADQQQKTRALLLATCHEQFQGVLQEARALEKRVREVEGDWRKESEGLMKEMKQQQESFFGQLQDREKRVVQANEKVAKLEDEIRFLTELEIQKSERSGQSAQDDASVPALSMKGEEEAAKVRKTLIQKYQLESYRLKQLLQSSQPSPQSLREDGVLHVAQLDMILQKLTVDDREKQRMRIKLDSKIKTLQDSNQYLEKRITQMIGEKEEEIIRLKSEVIVYKQKGKHYKEQMLSQKQDYDTNAEKQLQERVQAAKNQHIDEMRHIREENMRLNRELTRMKQENEDLQGKCNELERDFNNLNSDKNAEIEKLEVQLQGIESKHDRKLKKINVKKIETENMLKVEEKERELFGLKLEQVLINNKKLQLQKKFLEKQLEKDLREIHIEMNKIEIDIQQDQLLGPNSALHRFRSVYQQVSDQLHYIQQIVGFMEFDQEGLPGGQKAHIDPGVQPQTFEDVARDLQEKIMTKQQNEQQLYISHQDVQLSEQTPGIVGSHGTNVMGSNQKPNEGSVSQEMGSAPRQSKIQENDSSFKKGVFQNQTDLSINMVQQQLPGMMQDRPQVQMSGIHSRGTSYGQGANQVNDQIELTAALLNTLLELFQEVDVYPTEGILNMHNLVNSKAQPAVVKDISEKYFDQSRIQMQQYLLRQQDRCKELETECKNLQFRVQRAKLDMKRVDYSGPNGVQPSADLREEDIEQYSVEQIDDDGIPTTEPSRAGLGHQQPAEDQPRSRNISMAADGRDGQGGYNDEHEPIDNVLIDEDEDEEEGGRDRNSGRIDDIEQKLQSDSQLKKKKGAKGQGIVGPAVPGGAGSKAQYDAMVEEIESLRQQNQALKERCKEIRLNLQRKITELQDTLIITKQKFLSEISSLKVEYGLDLSQVTRTNEEKQEDLIKQMEKVKEDEIQQLQHGFDQEKRDLEDKILKNQEEAQQKIDETNQQKDDAVAELRKLKGESTGYSQGGWGTFVLAFEDQEATHKYNERNEKRNLYKNNQERTPRSTKQKHESPNAMKDSSSKRVGSFSNMSDALRVYSDTQDEFTNHPHPIEKINHFIEVGFLIDQNNFRLLDRHQELTYDAIIKKYLFELQDPHSNFQMTELEYKIKQQLHDNIGLFNELNPLYISLNMGRPAEPFYDDYINSEHYRLIEREGIYLMGNRWMMINFLRCDGNFEGQGSPHHEMTPNSRTNASKVSSEDGGNFNNGKGEQGSPTTKNGGPSLRVIAFENATMSQFSFDLNYYDLLTLMEGNMKLLEDENSHDLCQIILNNLTMIKREQFGKTDKQGNPIMHDFLIVEHKIFFNEQYRSIYDKKNKNIMAKYDKKRQGLVQDQALMTDFEKSVIYEAFETVYTDTLNLFSSQSSSPQHPQGNAGPSEPLGIHLLSGTMSGNTVLRVTFPQLEGEVREMCLFAKGQQRSHKVCSEIVYVPQKIIDSRMQQSLIQRSMDEGEDGIGSDDLLPLPQPLAFVISLEKLYGQDQILVLRLVLIEKWDENVMLDYTWQPEGKPQEGSTQFRAETLYLRKKNDGQYCRVTEYEILNTEIRTLLFMHSYGYIQSFADFGNIRRYLEQGEQRRQSYLSGLGTDEYFKEALNINISEPTDITEFQSLQTLIYRKFNLIRFRRFSVISGSDRQNFNSNNSPAMNRSQQQQMAVGGVAVQDLDEAVPAGGGQSQSQISQGRSGNPMVPTIKSEPDIINQDGDTVNQEALIAIFIDNQCLERNEVLIKIVIQELNVDIMHNIHIPSNVLDAVLLSHIINPSKREEVCGKILDQIVVEEYNQVPVDPQLHGSQGSVVPLSLAAKKARRLEIVIDSELRAISEIVLEAKQKTFEEMLRHVENRETDDNIQMEISDVTQMNVPLTTLANSPKTSINSIINQKPFKVHAYFVVNYPGFEPATPAMTRMFDWHFVFLEVVHRVADQQLVFAVTERDIVTIVQMQRQKMRVEGKDIKKNLIYKNMPMEEVLDFIMDCLVMDAATNEIRLSMIHLSKRVYERSILEQRFVINGGRFIKIKDGVDPEMQEFKTQVPNTELSMKLLTNNQKEMSDKGYDVKLYELELKSFPGTKKIRFEIFWLDDPETVFRCDMFSNENQDCSQIIVEKINIVEHIEYLKLKDKLITQDKYNPTKFAKDGLVLAICESNFPHVITFMLIEPCSHIQWEFSYQDDKLNVIEPRKQKMNFVGNLSSTFQNSILRGITDEKRAKQIRPGDQELVGEDQNKDTFFIVSDFHKLFSNQSSGRSESLTTNPTLIYSQSIKMTDKTDVFKFDKSKTTPLSSTAADSKGSSYRNLRIFSDPVNDTLLLRLEHLSQDLLSQNQNESKDQGQTGDGAYGREGSNSSALYPAQAFQRGFSKQNTDVIVKLNSQMEGSRIVSGAISYEFGLEEARHIFMNLIYTVEISCALERDQKVYRVSLFDQSLQRTIINVVFIDEVLYGRGNIQPEVMRGLRSGFIDSMAILQKISCLSSDYNKLQELEDIRQKTDDTRPTEMHLINNNNKIAGSDLKGNHNEGIVTGSQDLLTKPSQIGRNQINKVNQANMQQYPDRDQENTFMSISKLRERMINKSHKQSTLVFRQVMQQRGKAGPTSKNIMISALKESNPMYVNNSSSLKKPKRNQNGTNTKTQMKSSLRPPISEDEYLIKLIISETKRVEAPGEAVKYQINQMMNSGPQPATPDALPDPLPQHPSTFDMYKNSSNRQHQVNSPIPGSHHKKRGPPQQPQMQTLQKVQEFVFVYRYDEIFTKAELLANKDSMQELRTLRRMVANAIKKRLRVREIPDIINQPYTNRMSSLDSSQQAGCNKLNNQIPYRYVAFFIDDSFSQQAPQNPVTEEVDILEGKTLFDLRSLHSFALLDPSVKVLPVKEKSSHKKRQQQTLLFQFEKDDLLFDVFEVQNPEELLIRIKVYQQESFSMLTCCDITETDLRTQLVKDRRNYLTGSTQREELAKYIIDNSYFDEHANSLRFLISDLVEDI